MGTPLPLHTHTSIFVYGKHADAIAKKKIKEKNWQLLNTPERKREREIGVAEVSDNNGKDNGKAHNTLGCETNEAAGQAGNANKGGTKRANGKRSQDTH